MLESEYFESSPTKCPYLADKEEIVSYKYLLAPSVEHYSKYVQRGWRRFGSMLNRPKCVACKECINLRIDVEKFEFSKSARRILRGLEKFDIKISKPSINEKHIELYNKYHSFMNNKKSWTHNIITKELYKQSFVDNASNFGYELVYYDDDKIIAIDFIDIINDGISAIYFFYDPDYSSYSLGKLSIYYQIQKAKELKLKWIYMGYYVEECPSLNYKANYKPYQLLKGIPSINEDDIWCYPKNKDKTMSLKILLFDVDGTLADTEKDGHRVAFNMAFKDKGLDWVWDEKLYGVLLAVSGGKERIAHYIKNYLDDFSVDNQDDFIKELHKNKTKYYVELLKTSKISLRVGVERLIKEAKEQNMKMAIVTTTSYDNVKFLLENTLGKDSINDFELIAYGDIVPKKKPAPDIYLWALEKLNLSANECLAFEDSYNGVSSATKANIKTIATINDYTKNEDTTKASLIISQLGDKDNPMEVIQGDSLGYEFVNMSMIREWF